MMISGWLVCAFNVWLVPNKRYFLKVGAISCQNTTSNSAFFPHLGRLFAKSDTTLRNNNDTVFLIESKNCKKTNKRVCHLIIYQFVPMTKYYQTLLIH